MKNGKKQSIVSGGNFEEVTKPGKKAKFRSQFSYQNAMLVIKFYAGGKFSFLQKFKIPFEMPKYLENKSLGTKIGYFAQFSIFADISGYRQSQISLLICLLFSVGKLQTQK